MKKILIIEDEKNLADLLEENLHFEGFSVIKSNTGEDGLKIFHAHSDIDLVLLDINLPGINGWQVCKELKEFTSIPIVMMTARDSELDQIQGLELGAEDYITKPFSLKVLIVKLKKLLKISNGSIYKNEGFIFDMKNFSLNIHGEEIELTKKQFHLLDTLIKNRGLIMSREKLLNEIWGYDYFGDDRIVDTLVKRLRERMGLYGNWIKTVRGMGYSFNDKN